MAKAPANACWIYVFGEADGSFAKFGKTRNPAELRLAQHETRGPTKSTMKILAILLGHDADEQALRIHWKDIALKGTREWVTPTEKFREWLRFLKQQSYVARTFKEADDLDYVDSRLWLPSAAHAFKRKQGQFNFNNDPWSDLELDEEGDGDFYTNEIIIEAARHTMGAIDLDPASCRLANTVVRAERFFGALQDGLGEKWGGRIWLNPPFGQWEFWAPKLVSEIQSGRVAQACVLAPSRASTAKYFHPIVQRADALLMPFGRMTFWGTRASSPDEGHLIFYFGPAVDNFSNAFSRLGTIFVSRFAETSAREAAE